MSATSAVSRGRGLAKSLFVVLSIAAAPASAGTADFDARVLLQLGSLDEIEVGNGRGTLSELSDGSLALPRITLTGWDLTPFSPPAPSCVSSLGMRALALGPGTLATSDAGLGGLLPVSGALDWRWSAALGAGLAELTLAPGARGADASRTIPISTLAADVTVSFARWTTGSVELSGTVDGVVTTLTSVAGSGLTTTGGARMFTLVSPVHVHLLGTGVSKRRTLPGTARLVLTVPEPTLFALEMSAALVLATLGAARTRHARRISRP